MSCYKLYYLFQHILIWFCQDPSKNFLKNVSNCNASFLFKGTTPAYLLKISIKHNKKQISLANLLNNCISARLTPKILSIEEECNFCFANVLIIGLCNYVIM